MSAVATPEGLTEFVTRDVTGGRIEFEFAPAGTLTAKGEPRYRDWRAYFFTPEDNCLACEGSGRVPSEKRPGGTVKCKPCNGSGAPKRERLVSVTTLLGAILPKSGLPVWSEARGIEGAVAAMRMGEIHEGTDPADAVHTVRRLRLGADRARDDAATRGLNIHALLEEYMRTGDAPARPVEPEHWGYHQALCSWLLVRDPEPVAVEQLVADPAAGYGGRRDLVAVCDGVRIGFDAKTQENGGIYSSAHAQIRLYERAAIASGDEPCDDLRVVVFAANGEWREMVCGATPETAEAALAFYRQIAPIDSMCESHNRAEREARRA